MVSTFFEKFYVFSFQSPLWALKQAPWINRSTLFYGLLLFPVPAWILRLMFPAATVLSSLAVVVCASILHICMRNTGPGISRLRMGTEIIEWSGRRGLYRMLPEEEAYFNSWWVLKRQLIMIVNFFVFGIFYVMLNAPRALGQGLSLELGWALILTGASATAAFILPAILSFKLFRWSIQGSRFSLSDQA